MMNKKKEWNQHAYDNSVKTAIDNQFIMRILADN